jgi:pyruvate-formate lyase
MMQQSAIVSQPHEACAPPALQLSARVQALHETVRATRPAVSAERAVLITRYFRGRANRAKPMVLQKAEALAHVLRYKQVRIHPGELLVGCFTPHRVGGEIFPELHGIAMLEDLFRFERRQVNPFSISVTERRQFLFEVVPFWLTRFMLARVRPISRAWHLIREELHSPFSLINEAGGISHFVPNYEGLLALGTDGFRRQAQERLAAHPPDSPAADFLRAVQVVCDGLDDFAGGYRRAAEAQGRQERDEIGRAHV